MSQGDLFQLFGGYAFDPNSVEPQSDFEVLPPGKYPVMVEAAEIKQTKKQDGHYIKLTLSVLDGPCKGRKVWDQINIQNPNQQCVEIGFRQLAALGQAVGLVAIEDTNQLIGKACIASVKVKDEQNSVRTYAPIGTPNAGPPQQTTAPTKPAPTQPPVQQPQMAAASAGKPPWQR